MFPVWPRGWVELCSAARPGRNLTPGNSGYPFYRRLGGPQGRSGRGEKLVPTEIRSRTVQPVVSRNTDWATRPKIYGASFLILLGEIITFMLELFLLTTKYFLIISSRRNYAITIHYRFPPLFALTLHDVASMFFIRFGNWEGVRHLALKVAKDAKKIGERCRT